MRRRVLRVKETKLQERLYPLVRRRVFHVTRQQYLASILEDGGIRSNESGILPSTFGSSDNSFFRNRGCVSLFDLRHATTEQVRTHLPDCWPFQPAEPGSDIAIFVVSPAAYDRLIPWDRAKEEGALSEMILPYLESGFPKFLPLELISEIIEVAVLEVPGSVRAQFRNARTGSEPGRAV